MSQALASLEAVGRYLENAGNFPGLAQAMDSHVAFLQSQFSRYSWTMTEASEVLGLLQRQTMWSQVQRDALAQAVQTGLAARNAALSRQTMQDYTNVILYMPESVWSRVMDRNLTFQAKANVIGTFATALGLRNPSESTSQMVTSLLLQCPGGRDLESHCALEPNQLHQLFLLVKKEIKATIAVAPVADGFPHVERLPTQPEQMDPRWLQQALGTEAVGRCPLVVSQIASRALTIPMRSTNKQLLETKKSSRVTAMLSHMLTGLTMGEDALKLHGAPGSTVSLAADQLPRASTMLPLPAPPPPSVPCTVPDSLAAAAPPSLPASQSLSAATPPTAPQPAAKEQHSVVSAAAMLQAQWQEAKDAGKQLEAEREQDPVDEQETKSPIEKKERPKGKGKKCEAAKPKAKSKKEEKSKKVSVTKIAVQQKKSSIKKTKVRNLQDDYKSRRNAGVPVKVLKKFEHGCGRCRGRPYCTRSCWVMRGFSM